jgi:uncharacterized protein YkwD
LALTFLFSANILPAAASTATHVPDVRIEMYIGSRYMAVNGRLRLIDDEGSVPYIQDGRTMVPVRAVFEALSLNIRWEENAQTIIGTRGETEVRLTMGRTTAFRNGLPIILDVAPRMIGGRVFVPLRFVAESAGARVTWNEATQSVLITSTPLFIRLGDAHININDTLDTVRSQLGFPDRMDPSNGDFVWHVYNSNLNRFIMVGIRNNRVVALYTNSRGFMSGYGDYGQLSGGSGYGGWARVLHPVVTLYRDSFRNGMVYAVLIVTATANIRMTYDDNYCRATEMQVLDVTNAFRANFGLPPLVWCPLAAGTAREHSVDMANHNYFAHEGRDGLQSWDRFAANGGTYRALGENLAGSTHHPTAMNFFDQWINSQTGHRTPILSVDYERLGVGMAINADARYVHYIGQIFYTDW